MALIKPFAALRPKPELAGRICELPYDVVSSEEARAIAAGNPLSFFHISKPEIDLPPSVNSYDSAVYAHGKKSFDALLTNGALQPEPAPAYYLYRQIMGSHTQVGLVAAASCEAYLQGRIKKHEFTRPDKEDDRVRHIETLQAQTGPAFLVYRAIPSLDEFIARIVATAPETDFTATDGVRHSAWALRRPEEIDTIQKAFATIPALYIADGHHRTAAAGRIHTSRAGAGQSAWFLSVIFPHNQIQILPYNRVLKDLHGLKPAELLKRLGEIFTIADSAAPTPTRAHELSLYMEGTWRKLVFRPQYLSAPDAIERLDATLLQRHVLAPLFGIDNPRTSQRINFVGGIRGAAELEKLVNSGDYACAFAMYPTGIEELMTIADAGGIMPPKSTWFEPKLRDGMFSHRID